MDTLDNLELMSSSDPQGMREHLRRFPEQLAEALKLGRESRLKVAGEGVSSVVAAGMGGSAMGGELAAAVLSARMHVPFVVVRNYAMPEHVGPGTLVYVSSYSGNTEETLSAFADARERGARIVCSTTGGELGRLADENGLSVITLPAGYPPRAALAFGLVPLLVVLAKLGLAPEPDADVTDAMRTAEEAVRRFGVETESPSNPAKELATWLHGVTPVVYGTLPVTSAAATRWCGQMAENSKIVAHRNELPEMNHNEIVGWSCAQPFGGTARVVFLRDEDDHPRVSRRIEITGEIVRENGAETREVFSFGRSPLARMLSLVQLGDYVSLYLALLAGVDPTPVRPIDRLKGALASP